MLSKHEQIVNGIINSIDDGVVTKGSMLPSVNHMVEELGFARKTIVKAYSDLKSRGLIESKNRLGYFVASEQTEQELRVAVLLYAFHTFQEIFYNTFRKALGKKIQIDIFFHHNNVQVYEQILSSIIGQYGMYVIAPIHNDVSRQALSAIPTNRLLLVDRYEFVGSEYSYIAQEFEDNTFQVLESMVDRVKDFDEFILFFKKGTDYPVGTRKGFERFCEQHNLNSRIEEAYVPGSLKPGDLFLTIGDTDLWNILRDCKEMNIEPGNQIGIISNNDSPVKEIISGGITTYYSDFKEMAQQAAAFVFDRNKVQKILPITIQRRKSF